MTVRFKSQSEYQKSYRVPRSRSVSPQRCAPLAGLRSDQMGISREPGLQRRKRLSPGGLTQSCSSLLCPPDPQPTAHIHRTAPPAASRSRSAHRKEPKPPTPAGAAADPGSAQPETPAGPRPAAEPRHPAGPRAAAEPGPPGEPGAVVKSVKPHPSSLDSQPQLSRPLTAAPDGQQPSANEQAQHALRWRAGLRSGGQRSEYHRQYGWKKHATAASPILTAEQALLSRSVPPFKKNPVPMATEYQRSFQGLAPPAEPCLRKHLEYERVPLFLTHMTNNKRREESERKPRPKQDVITVQEEDATPPPPQVQRGHRTLTEYQSSFRSPLCRILEEGGAPGGGAPQVSELRQKALMYRRRGWGANFSRDHLSQLQSEHNALWEPSDTTGSTADPPTPCPTLHLCRDPDSRGTSHVEALDLSSNSSRRSSVCHANKNTHMKARTPASPPAERRAAWGAGEDTDEEEGRLPTPRLKILPVQRTHHDLTTPATGGALLVGKLRSGDDSSPSKQQRCGSAVSMAAAAETAAVNLPLRQWEALPESSPTHINVSGPSPDHKPAVTPPSKPTRRKQMPPSPVAPPPAVPPPHGIQGTLRHPDFQHNGALGLRFREPPCSGGGCCSDEDDRLSVMSWRSAASCSMASAVLERAQKRRENFWGKR